MHRLYDVRSLAVRTVRSPCAAASDGSEYEGSSSDHCPHTSPEGPGTGPATTGSSPPGLSYPHQGSGNTSRLEEINYNLNEF